MDVFHIYDLACSNMVAQAVYFWTTQQLVMEVYEEGVYLLDEKNYEIEIKFVGQIAYLTPILPKSAVPPEVDERLAALVSILKQMFRTDYVFVGDLKWIGGMEDHA